MWVTLDKKRDPLAIQHFRNAKSVFFYILYVKGSGVVADDKK